MNEGYMNFLSVLSRAIHGKYSEQLTSPVDWNQVCSVAQAHKLLPLIVQSEKENEDFFSNENFKLSGTKTVGYMVSQIKRTEEFRRLYKKMNENGIFPIVVKGIVCRELYGNFADCRISGDEDIFVKKEDFEAVDSFLKSLGFVPDRENVTENQKNFIQEVTYTSENSDLRIEVHLSLLGTEDELRRKMNAYFADAFENYIEVSSGNLKIRTLNHTGHFLFLIFHALKHLTVTGFGIRMVCDILLYAEKHEEDIDFDFVYKALEDVCGVSFFEDIIYIGNEYLGFSLPVRGEKNCPDELLEDILESGIYGNSTQSRRTSAHLVHMAFSNRRISSKFGKAGLAFDAAFPPKSKFRETCPEIDEKPWLIVREYFKRIGRFLSHSKENNGNLAAESMKIGEKRIELLKKYKLL